MYGFTSHPVLETAGWAMDWAVGDSHPPLSLQNGYGWGTGQGQEVIEVGVWAPVGNVLSGPEPRRKEWQQGGKQPQLVRTEKEGAATAGSVEWKSALVRCCSFPKSLLEVGQLCANISA